MVRSGRVKGWIARSTFLPILLLAISKSYCACRFCHSCALAPKYRDSRSAISAVIARIYVPQHSHANDCPQRHSRGRDGNQ
jgi:hypothetical protein